MGRHVKRNYLINLYNQFCIEQEKNCDFCSRFNCKFCLQTLNLEQEFTRNDFSTKNKTHDNWFVIYYQNNGYQITLFPVFTKKKIDLEKITVKYFAKNEFCKEPYQASEDAAGYDLYAAETLTLFPKDNGCISLACRFAVPKGFYGKIFPRSGLLRDHLITCDGVLDADFRGIVRVIVINHHPEKALTIRTGDRIAQCVFMKKYNVEFQKVPDMAILGITKRGADGFGSTGGITKVIKLDDSDSENNENQMLILQKKKLLLKLIGMN